MSDRNPTSNPTDDTGSAPPPKVLVVGAGAVGAYYGAKLARAGARVMVTCRSDYQAVQRDGFRFESIDGPFTFQPAALFPTPADYDGPPPDYLLLTTKVLPELDRVALIRPVVAPHTVIVLLQNGVEIEEPVARAFPHNEVLSGLAFICVSRVAPGVIHHLCFGRVMVGRYPRGPSPAADRLVALFREAGVDATATDQISLARWRKLVWNAPFNPLSVLGGGLTTREILAAPQGEELAREVMREVCRLATAAGHPLGEEAVAKNIDDTRVMKPYRTSMLLDHLAGRPMEVEAILGNAVRAARRLEVAVPRLETLYALLTLLTTAPPGVEIPRATGAE